MESNYRNPAPPMGNAAAPPTVRFGEWIGEGWRMFTEQWKSWVVLSLGMFGVVAVPSMIFMVVIYGMVLSEAVIQNSRTSSYPPSAPNIWPIYLAFFLFMLLIMPLAVFLVGGMYRAAFKQLRGGRIEFKDIFSAKDCYLRLLGAAVLMYFVIMVGTMLCIVPGLIAAGLLFFTFPLIIERNMGVIDAMKTSIEVTKPNILMFTLFAFVVQLIGSAGTYACYIGLLATYPLMFTMHAVAFRDCFGVPGARSFAQQLPPASIYAPPPPQMAQAPPPPAPSLACPNCHTTLPSTAVFCPKCGTSVRR
jgi:hypothetical protein